MAKITLPKSQKRIHVGSSKKIEGLLNYDTDNLYPQRMYQYSSASGTTVNCIKTYKSFIIGKGFKDGIFYKSKVNSKGETVDQILYKVACDLSQNQGYAIHVNYNAAGQRTSAKVIPFDWCRIGDWSDWRYNGKILVYYDWGKCREKTINEDIIRVYDSYNPDPEVVKMQMANAGGPEKWSGQILYSTVDGRNVYPLSKFDSVIEDVYSDAGIKNFRLKAATTSFLANIVIRYPYAFESEDERDEASSAWSKFQGTDNANRVIILEDPNMGQEGKGGIKIEQLEAKPNTELFSKTNQEVKNSIIESFSMPPILAGVQIPGKLGTSQEMKDAYEIYNAFTISERMMVEQDFKDIFEGWFYKINHSSDYSIIPASFGFSELKEEPLISKLGVGGTQALVSIISDPNLNEIQKINMLNIVFGITIDDAQKLILPIQTT